MVEERQRLRRDPTPTIQEYEAGLRIDEHALQQECRNQPETFYHIARRVSKARADYEDARTHLKRTSAQAEIDIRQQAEESETRITEARVASLVLASQSVVLASDRVNDCRIAMEEIEALKEAYQQRKDMLRELVQLYISSYYSDPIRGAETRMRDVATEGVRRARREQREQRERR